MILIKWLLTKAATKSILFYLVYYLDYIPSLPKPNFPGPSLPGHFCPNPSLHRLKFAQSQICPDPSLPRPNLPRPIFAQAKFAQSQVCPKRSICVKKSTKLSKFLWTETQKFQIFTTFLP